MSFLGIGDGTKREAERKTRQAQDRANQKAVREFNGIQQLQTAYAKESLEFKKRNDETTRNYQNQQLYDRRNFDVEQRDYEFDQAMRVYDTQMQRYTDQKGFNQIAFDQAMRQQSRYMHETLVGMEFDKSQTFLNFSAASAGLNLKKAGAKAGADIQLGRLRETSYQALDVAKTQTAFGKRQANIEALKAGGQLAARGGAGVSVGKAQQGIKAELGAAKAQMSKQLVQQQRKVAADMFFNQRDIVNQLLTTEASADLELSKLNYQLDLDQAKMDISRDNLMANDKLVRDRIALQRKQADLNNIEPLKPEETPEIPPVRELPVLEYQPVFEPPDREMPDALPKGLAAYTDWGKIATDVVTLAGGVLSGGLGAGAGGTFHWGKGLAGGLGALTGVPGLSKIIPGKGNVIGGNSGGNVNPFNMTGPGANFSEAMNLGSSLGSSSNSLLNSVNINPNALNPGFTFSQAMNFPSSYNPLLNN